MALSKKLDFRGSKGSLISIFIYIFLFKSPLPYALNKKILNLLNEESVSGESSGRASL